MKLAAITTASLLIGFLLAFMAVKTAEQIAKATLSRCDVAQLEETQP